MKGRVSLLAGLFCLGMAVIAMAQVSTIEGTVVSSSAGSLVIDTGKGQQTFMVDAQSSLPAGLAAGSRVTVEYHTLANNQLHAFKVSTMGAAATAPTRTTDTPSTMATPERTEPQETTTSPAPAATTRTDTTTTTRTEPMETTTGTTQGTTGTAPMGTTTATEPATDTERSLPATASPLPLLALAGGLSIAGGMLVRRLRS